ncbi:hypothetical protein SBADM41S_08494 [Streptomyces badius]
MTPYASGWTSVVTPCTKGGGGIADDALGERPDLADDALRELADVTDRLADDRDGRADRVRGERRQHGVGRLLDDGPGLGQRTLYGGRHLALRVAGLLDRPEEVGSRFLVYWRGRDLRGGELRVRDTRVGELHVRDLCVGDVTGFGNLLDVAQLRHLGVPGISGVWKSSGGLRRAHLRREAAARRPHQRPGRPPALFLVAVSVSSASPTRSTALASVTALASLTALASVTVSTTSVASGPGLQVRVDSGTDTGSRAALAAAVPSAHVRWRGRRRRLWIGGRMFLCMGVSDPSRCSAVRRVRRPDAGRPVPPPRGRSRRGNGLP